MAEEKAVTQARTELADMVNQVVYSGRRFALTRHGKTVAALVSAEDLAVLESLAAQHIDLTAAGPAPVAQPVDPLRIAAEYRPGGRPGFRA
jgi:prevent-host-death family protein